MGLSAEQRTYNALQHQPDFCKLLPSHVFKMWNTIAGRRGRDMTMFIYSAMMLTSLGMGANSTVKVNDSWQETILLWFITAAYKGEGKSLAFGYFEKELEIVEAFIRRQETVKESDTNCVLKLSSFTFESLFPVLEKMNGKLALFYDEFGLFLQQLDLYKKGSSADRSMVLSMYNGCAISRRTTQQSIRVASTRISIGGYWQPEKVMHFLDSDGASDGFADRFWVAFAQPKFTLLNEYCQERETVAFSDILIEMIKLDQEMPTAFNFVLAADAQKIFEDYHDNLVRKRKQLNDLYAQKRKGLPEIIQDMNDIEQKGQSLILKMSCIIEALSYFTFVKSERVNKWNPVVSSSSITAAISIVRNLIAVKSELLGLNMETDVSGNLFEVFKAVVGISEKHEEFNVGLLVQKRLKLNICGEKTEAVKSDLVPYLQQLKDLDILKEKQGSRTGANKFSLDLSTEEARANFSSLSRGVIPSHGGVNEENIAPKVKSGSDIVGINGMESLAINMNLVKL